MIKQEQIAAYREMAKNAGENSMEAQIRANLEATSDKFAGNEDKFDRCIEYLTDCAREILNSENGEIPDEVCFRICRDYFNDEIWKAEDMKPTAEAQTVLEKWLKDFGKDAVKAMKKVA